MIVLIDNYDSFSYNLYQLIGGIRPDLTVIRNDRCTVDDLRAMAPEAIFLSPGPGRPADAGICEDAIRALAGEIPIFGVCLGHQAISETFGGRVSYAKQLMHGKVSQITPLPPAASCSGAWTRPSPPPGTIPSPPWRTQCPPACGSPYERRTGKSWRWSTGISPSAAYSSIRSPS